MGAGQPSSPGADKKRPASQRKAHCSHRHKPRQEGPPDSARPEMLPGSRDPPSSGGDKGEAPWATKGKRQKKRQGLAPTGKHPALQPAVAGLPARGPGPGGAGSGRVTSPGGGGVRVSAAMHAVRAGRRIDPCSLASQIGQLSCSGRGETAALAIPWSWSAAGGSVGRGRAHALRVQLPGGETSPLASGPAGEAKFHRLPGGRKGARGGQARSSTEPVAGQASSRRARLVGASSSKAGPSTLPGQSAGRFAAPSAWNPSDVSSSISGLLGLHVSIFST